MATSSKPAAKPKPKLAAAPAKKVEKTVKAAKPAAAKPAATKAATAPKKVAPAKKPAGRSAPAVAKGIAPERKRYYVEVAAYYIAERRGFHGGSELDDWVQAEREIDRLLSEGILKP
jgi:hypothetical protein